ncbi:MAG: hypothetical protein KC481_11060 [Acidimicrobiaceae bacterium]|jgi:hypothetical protein|nr:hypothetical protein [Acidimicrobiaceae bacterium]MCH9805505.1 hypothetical protein [bacterium]MDC1388934.1 hypothetical protein [Acidimicrobiales bacterium]MBT6446463.1 hypothetical protein [Acidimicrobiaceae bacterium]MCO4834190.1 hypothetical protein [Acidimicrobiaceae bacterium]
MSPLLFLLIPLVIFVIGSCVLFGASRFSGGGFSSRNAPADLRAVAPMLKGQREAGWPVSSNQHARR